MDDVRPAPARAATPFDVRIAQHLRSATRRLGLTGALRRLGLTRATEERLLRRHFDDPEALVDIDVLGFRLSVPGTSLQGYLHDRYEPSSLRWLADRAARSRACVDVGAHIGLTALVMATAGGANRSVLAVEPAPGTITLLRRNLERNGVTNVLVTSRAGGAGTERATLYLSDQSERTSLHPDGIEARSTATVQVAALDDLVSEHLTEPVDLVKIDVEGGELDVLAGATRTLGTPTVRALVEWNPEAQAAAGHDPAALPGTLRDLGFELRVLDDGRGGDTVEGVLGQLADGQLPEGWYANLACERSVPHDAASR